MKRLVVTLAVALVINAVPGNADQVAFAHVTVVDLVDGRLSGVPAIFTEAHRFGALHFGT